MRTVLACLAFGGLVLVAETASTADDDATTKARVEYVVAQKLVAQEQWGEALAAFERSLALRAHALTMFNVGVCERNLGRYTRARRTFAAALARHDENGAGELAASYVEEAKGYIAEIDGILVHVELTVLPEGAALQVDGRPITTDASGAMIAGIDPPGPGRPPPKITFGLVADPGAHLFTITRKGFSTVSVSKSWKPGAHEKLVLEADKLPAVLRVRADVEGSVVRIGGLDVGVAPIEVSRPAGTYAVEVTKVGFVTYKTSVDARPGELVDLSASLPVEKVPLTSKWWFWTVSGVVVTGAVVGTYYLTRPAPQRPGADGGGLGWVVTVP
jgi:hypothetical protein